ASTPDAPGASQTVWRAAARPGSGAPGTRVELGPRRLALACGEGVLELLEVQRPGGRRVAARDLLAAA
ncbi:MAG: hypothetical protein ACK5RW_01455, partial [bacterium]